jgi:hypothetical protein
MRRLSLIIGFVFAVLSTSLFAQATPPPESRTSPPARLKAFTVTLVLGDTQPGASDSLAREATKALADLKDFLPYKQYRLLDPSPMIGLNGPHIILRPGDQKYEFYMRSTDVSPKTTQVDMLRLWEMRESTQEPKKTNYNLLIDTAFKIDVGETVVVGTSRLDGSKALILLVSAVR